MWKNYLFEPLHVNIAIDYHLIFDDNITAESKISH